MTGLIFASNIRVFSFNHIHQNHKIQHATMQLLLNRLTIMDSIVWVNSQFSHEKSWRCDQIAFQRQRGGFGVQNEMMVILFVLFLMSQDTREQRSPEIAPFHTPPTKPNDSSWIQLISGRKRYDCLPLDSSSLCHTISACSAISCQNVCGWE